MEKDSEPISAGALTPAIAAAGQGPRGWPWRRPCEVEPAIRADEMGGLERIGGGRAAGPLDAHEEEEEREEREGGLEEH